MFGLKPRGVSDYARVVLISIVGAVLGDVFGQIIRLVGYPGRDFIPVSYFSSPLLLNFLGSLILIVLARSLWIRNISKSMTPGPEKVFNLVESSVKPKGLDKKTSSGSIFISYRREDSAEIVGRIYDRLLTHFGKSAVFKDVDSIPLGVDFRMYVEQFMGKCDLALVVIGPQWILAVDGQGNARLQNPQDHVRIEIEAALMRDIPVIPIFVGNALMPGETELPTSLRQLSFRNGISVRSDPDFNNDIGRLINGIKSHLKSSLD